MQPVFGDIHDLLPEPAATPLPQRAALIKIVLVAVEGCLVSVLLVVQPFLSAGVLGVGGLRLVQLLGLLW